MSGFDTSPFGDPFADPSITQVTGNPNNAPGLDDYNPFANQGTKPNAAQVRGASNPPQATTNGVHSQPAVLETSRPNNVTTSAQPPPAYSQSAAQNITQADLQRRQEELERKAAELAAREEALRTGNFNAKAPNWPPVPTICPFGPCIYQDINIDIPVEFQRVVRLAYYLWMYYIGVLLANFIGGIAMWSSTGDTGNFGFSLMAMLILTPVSFLCWFRPLYKAFRSDSSFNFMVFFFVFFCQMVLSIIWAIGIPGTGACGLITALTSIGKGGVFYTLVMFMVSFVMISYAIFSFLVLVKVHSIYRSTGASFAKAQAEFATGVMRNEHVQQAASAAAAGAARQAMGQAFSGGNNTDAGGIRY